MVSQIVLPPINLQNGLSNSLMPKLEKFRGDVAINVSAISLSGPTLGSKMELGTMILLVPLYFSHAFLIDAK